MKTPHQACKFIISILIFYFIAAGCSGKTHTSAAFTLFEIPLGHASEPTKSIKNKKGRIKEGTNYLPKKLGELSLTKIIQNEEASSIINKMHGKKLSDCENIIAYYGNKNSRNTLYVSVYKNAEEAKTNLMSKAIKMAKGTSVFSPLNHSKMGNDVHFKTEGMGLKHYFYRIDNILIWWQVGPDKAEATYNDLLKFDFAILNDRINSQ
jgi:hypothetical protein